MNDNNTANPQPPAPETPDRVGFLHHELIHGLSYGKILIFSALGIVLISVLGVVFLLMNQEKKPRQAAVNVEPWDAGQQSVASGTGMLPSLGTDGSGIGAGAGSSTLELQAENMLFGDFYQPRHSQPDNVAEVKAYPINVKAETVNFYDINRQIDLTAAVEDLNQYGFALIDDPVKAGDFFSYYRDFQDKDIPVVVTADFLIYAYQNILKEAYNEVERGAFFESVWNLDSDLYRTALSRFRRQLVDVGTENDPILEGMRMETSFLAVALELLSVTPDQVDKDGKFNNADYFSQQEAETYSLDLPESIKEQVMSEVERIKEAEETAKSSVLLYDIDYRKFALPPEYRYNPKLGNFYLAKKWLNSVFPLYYRSETCPDCLLDYDDWMITTAAAGFLSQDFSRDQETKNKWAAIYKVIAYFSGLRQDLTYIYFQQALLDTFGSDYDLTAIFAPDGERTQRLAALQDSLASVGFFTIEGSQDRTDPAVKPRLGFRVLQEPYWPNDYIFDRLTGPEMLYNGTFSINKRSLSTICAGEKRTFYRCNGFGMDIVNLLKPGLINNFYFETNTDYAGYPDQVVLLSSEIGNFDHNSWNNNIYWSSLDLVRSVLNADRSYYPFGMTAEKWLKEREADLSLAAWVNVHLPPDQWLGYDGGSSGLGGLREADEKSLVEPNLQLIDEIMAKTDMMVKSFSFLGLDTKSNTAAVELKDFYNKLDNLRQIALKQIRGEVRTDEDSRNIKEFTTSRSVGRKNDKKFVIESQSRNLSESIEDFRILLMVGDFKDGKSFLAAGPVFKYFESY